MTDKNHKTLITTAALLAFATEGWFGTMGEPIAHSVGVGKGMIYVVGATLFAYVYSVIFDMDETPKQRRPPAPRKPKPKPRKRSH